MPGAAQASDAAAARGGAAWLSSAVKPGADGMAADAIVAMRAAGRLPAPEAARRARALRAGAGGYARTAGATGKTILALAAARNGSARCAGKLDLLTRLQSYGRAGRYGSTIFDQTLAMLASHALRAGPSQRAVSVLLDARGAARLELQPDAHRRPARRRHEHRDGDPRRRVPPASRPATRRCVPACAGCAPSGRRRRLRARPPRPQRGQLDRAGDRGRRGDGQPRHPRDPRAALAAARRRRLPVHARRRRQPRPGDATTPSSRSAVAACRWRP